MNGEKLRAVLEFYRDLGFTHLYHCEYLAASEAGLPTPRDSAQPEGCSEPALIKLPGFAPAGDTLERIREDIGDCKRCRLHQGRHTIVFGSGNERAKLVFVGEGPGADEDLQGLPFVGRAGQLLTQMIEAMGLQRKDVYICNVVKCRPPENR